jgi:hypothetical protein
MAPVHSYAKLAVEILAGEEAVRVNVFENARGIASRFRPKHAFVQKWQQFEPELRARLEEYYAENSIPTIVSILKAVVVGWAFMPTEMERMYSRLADPTDSGIRRVNDIAPAVRSTYPELFAGGERGRRRTPLHEKVTDLLNSTIASARPPERRTVIRAVRDWVLQQDG